jgi:hypothetical protein
MAIDVTVRARINRPAAEVGAFLTDPRNDPEWIGGLIEVHPPSAPLELGTRVERVASFMGRRIEYVLEVVRFEPGRALEMRAVRSPFPMLVSYVVEEARDSSIVSLRVEGGPGGPMRVLHPLMVWQVRRNLRGDLDRLRRVLERSTR